MSFTAANVGPEFELFPNTGFTSRCLGNTACFKAFVAAQPFCSEILSRRAISSAFFVASLPVFFPQMDLQQTARQSVVLDSLASMYRVLSGYVPRMRALREVTRYTQQKERARGRMHWYNCTEEENVFCPTERLIDYLFKEMCRVSEVRVWREVCVRGVRYLGWVRYACVVRCVCVWGG